MTDGYPPVQYQHLRFHWVMTIGTSWMGAGSCAVVVEWTKQNLWRSFGNSRLFGPSDATKLWTYLVPCLEPLTSARSAEEDSLRERFDLMHKPAEH